MTPAAPGNAAFFRSFRIHYIVLLALLLRWLFMSGFVLGDDPIYADYVGLLLEGRYPPLCDMCVFSYRWLLLWSMELSVRILNWSELGFVFPFLASSILSVYLAWGLGRHLFDEEAGLLAALLLAVFPLDVVHATTIANDLLLAMLLALAVLLYLKAFAASGLKALLLFALAGALLASAIGVKINSLPVVGLFMLIGIYKEWQGTKRRSGMAVFLLSWLAVQMAVCAAFYLKTGDPLAHIHAELNFNLRHNPAIYSDTYDHLKHMLMFYPRLMLGLSREGHLGYTFLPYGWFYPVLLASLAWSAVRKELRIAIPLLWLTYLFLMMEFTPLRIQPYYEPIHRLPRFLAIVTMPALLIIAFFLRQLFSSTAVSRIAASLLVAGLVTTSLHQAYSKSFFYNDCMADARLAYDLIKYMPFSEIATDQEMKNALLFFDRNRSEGLIRSFEHDSPRFPAESLVILGGSRRPDMHPDYAEKFVSAIVPQDNWLKICQVNRPLRMWRTTDLVIYRVLDTGGQP